MYHIRKKIYWRGFRTAPCHCYAL